MRALLDAGSPSLGPGAVNLLCALWPHLAGGRAHRMRPRKLRRALGSARWEAPRLSFRIERHPPRARRVGLAVIEEWTVDLAARTASVVRVGHTPLVPGGRARFRAGLRGEPAPERSLGRERPSEAEAPLLARVLGAVLEDRPDPCVERAGPCLRVQIHALVPRGRRRTRGATSRRRQRLGRLVVAALAPRGWRVTGCRAGSLMLERVVFPDHGRGSLSPPEE